MWVVNTRGSLKGRTMREEKEEEVERVYTELVEKHGKSEYSIPLL